MNDQRIALLTDTGTAVAADFIAEHDIRVVPLRINYSDGTSYESGVTITSDELVTRFAKEIPSTSLPSPECVSNLFKQAQADGYTKAIFVVISSGLSATCETIRLVASNFTDFPIEIIDTKNIGIAAGLLVMRAAELIEQGLGFTQIVNHLKDLVPKTQVFFSMKELDFLYKGGRIGKAVYGLGTILNIKPVLTCNAEGKYVVAAKPRGFKHSLEGQIKQIETLAKRYGTVRLAVCTYNNDELEQQLETEIRERLEGQASILSFTHSALPPDLLVHTGPSLVGLAIQAIEPLSAAE